MNKQIGNKLIKGIVLVFGYIGSRVEKLVSNSPIQQEKLSVVKRLAFSKAIIVTTILTTLIATTVVALNPIELLAQTRDSGADNIGFFADSTSRISIDNNIGISALPPEGQLTVTEITRPTIDSNRFSGNALQATPVEATTSEGVLPNKSLSNQTSGSTNTTWVTNSNSFNNRVNAGIRTTIPMSSLNRVERGVLRHTFLPLTVNSSGVAGVVITGGNRHESGTTNYRRIIAQGTAITLTAPAMVTGGAFSNWTGCDSVTGAGNRTCNLILNTARTVTANYYAFMTMTIEAGGGHTLAIRTDGTLWVWGRNEFGQLGLGDGTNRLIPTQVGTDANWSRIAADNFHSLAVRTDGTLWAWGRNNFGQLGLNDTTHRLIPTQVGTDTNWSRVAAGLNHTLAIRTDGTLWVWGANESGQLGLNDTINRHIPTQVGTDTNWSRVEASSGHTLAIRTDGTLWVWGRNNGGQLGLNDTTNRHIPTRVGTDTNWSRVAAGSGHTLAIRTDGTLWAWGANESGQLGLNDITRRLVPTRVGTDTNWSRVAAGSGHTLAIRTDGTLWAWGANESGQLGLNDITRRLVPTRVGTDNNWIGITGGNFHTLAIRTDGTLWAWGSNDSGRLGLGEITDIRHIPTQVGNNTNW